MQDGHYSKTYVLFYNLMPKYTIPPCVIWKHSIWGRTHVPRWLLGERVISLIYRLQGLYSHEWGLKLVFSLSSYEIRTSKTVRHRITPPSSRYVRQDAGGTLLLPRLNLRMPPVALLLPASRHLFIYLFQYNSVYLFIII